MDLLWYSASLRLSCAVAFSSCASATLRFAWAWVRLFCGMRGSIFARSVPFLTSSPVWTGISRISPEAFDFTLSVRMGWITPDAVAVTTMSRRATGIRRSEEHTSELQSRLHLVCRLLLEKKKSPRELRGPLGAIGAAERCGA